MSSLKLILFDIDGTLLLTGGAGKKAINIAFQELYDVAGAWGEMVPDGKTDPLILEEIFQNKLNRKAKRKESDWVRQLYVKYFRQEIEKAPRFKLLPGVRALLRNLASTKGFLLGLATGNFEETAWLKLERGGIDPYFSFGGFGSDSPDRAKLTRMAIGRARIHADHRLSSILLIGDAPQDVLTGKKLGIHTLAVATGRASKEELAAYHPDFLLDDFSDSTPFLKILSSL